MCPSPTWTLVINPAAGHGRCGQQAPQGIEALRARKIPLELLETKGPNDAFELARKAYQGGARKFLVAGGDGTVYEVINGLFAAGLEPGKTRAVLGVLPLGTGNSLSKDLGIHEVSQLADAIVQKSTRPMDVIRAAHDDGELYYLNILSLGFSAKVGSLTNRRFKRLGRHGYTAAVFFSLMTLDHPSFPFSLDEGPRKARPATLLSFSNSRFTGGNMMMAPNAKIDDGQLDVIEVGAMSRRQLLRALPKIFPGKHIALPEVFTSQAKEVHFNLSGPVDIMVDGEILSLHLEKLEVLPGAIDILVAVESGAHQAS